MVKSSVYFEFDDKLKFLFEECEKSRLEYEKINKIRVKQLKLILKIDRKMDDLLLKQDSIFNMLVTILNRSGDSVAVKYSSGRDSNILTSKFTGGNNT